MSQKTRLFLLVCTLGTLSIQLVTPAGGFVLVAGNSMDPAIPAGCSVVGAQSWDGESSLEGEVVAFDSNHVETEIEGSTVLDTEPWVAHRVVAEYEAYDATEATHYVSEKGSLVVEGHDETTILESPQRYADVKAMEDDRVFVLKGDNNTEIDRVLVHEDEILGVLDDDTVVQIQDDESWPCGAVDPLITASDAA